MSARTDTAQVAAALILAGSIVGAWSPAAGAAVLLASAVALVWL